VLVTRPELMLPERDRIGEERRGEEIKGEEENLH
jgi:hypothetical protein